MFIIPSWVILASFAGLSSNAFNFFNRYFLKDKDDPIMYAWYVEVFKFVCFLVISIFDWKLVINPKSIIIFIAVGVSEAISALFYMKMHYYSHLSVSSIISRTRFIWVSILAFFLLGEVLKPLEYLGILIIFAGLITVVAPKKLFVDKGVMHANFAAFFIALTLVLMKMALPYSSNAVLNATLAIPSILALPFFVKNFKQKLYKLKNNKLGLKSFAISLNVINLYLITAALRIGESGKVIAIYQGMLIFSVLAGIVFLKERENIWKKLIGAVVVVIGVLLLA